MPNIYLNLTPQELKDLLSILEDAPYKKVSHLIQLIQKQAGIVGSEANANDDSQQPKLKVGDRIRARWLKGNTWYNGTIGDSKNGEYFINYDDGDEEWTTEEYIELISRPGNDPNARSLAVGDRVKARWKGGETWYKGKISEIKGSQYFINYDDGDVEWTTADLITKL